MKKTALLQLFMAVSISFSLFAQPPLISYSPVITGLSAPVDLVNAGDGSNRLFIVQQTGMIRVWDGSTTSDFLDLGNTGLSIISLSGGERGLLSMAFHPDYDGVTNRYFFVYYTDLAGDIAIQRFESMSGNPNMGDPASGQIILTIPHPGNDNHNGGKLNFGPDGHLYFATGDGGGANDIPNNAQNPMSLLGKMIRINVDNFTTPPYYTVPSDNPYVGDASFDDRIFDLGLRNPFRWSFDRANGNMWIGDVGQGAQEEISFVAAADAGHNNFGWRCFEGYISTPGVADCTPPDYIPPVYDYENPPSDPSAVTGGYVYRGTEYPAFNGYYVSADVYSGTLHFLWPNGSGGFDSAVQNGLTNFVVGFGEAEDGTLYAVSQATNTVYKLVATGGTPLPVKLVEFNVRNIGGQHELLWETATEDNTKRFIIEHSGTGREFRMIGELPALGRNGSRYQFINSIPPSGTSFYRLQVEDFDERRQYSSVLRMSGSARNQLLAYPTVIENGMLNICLPESPEAMRILNAVGSSVYEKALPKTGGTFSISLPSLAPGSYLVLVFAEKEWHTARILIR